MDWARARVGAHSGPVGLVAPLKAHSGPRNRHSPSAESFSGPVVSGTRGPVLFARSNPVSPGARRQGRSAVLDVQVSDDAPRQQFFRPPRIFPGADLRIGRAE